MRTTILFFILILLLASSAIAEEFFAQAPELIEICRCSTATNPITITNTNPSTQQLIITITDGQETATSQQTIPSSTYTISQSGKAARYSTLFPSILTLEGGKSETIQSFITASCKDTGNFDLSTSITTTQGLTKILDQKVKFIECDNIDFSIQTDTQYGCPCTTLTWKMILRNTGSFTEIYHIGTSKAHQQSLALSDNPVILEPGKSKEVIIFFNGPCSLYGDIDIPIRIHAANNNIIKTSKIAASIDPCYSAELITGKEIRHFETEEDYFVPYTGNYEICEKEPYIRIPIQLLNTDQRTDSYTLSLDAPAWAELSHTNIIDLSNNEYAETFIVMNPYANLDEDYAFKISLTSDTKKITATYDIPVSVKKCVTPQITLKRVKVNHSILSTTFPVINTGNHDASYDLSINLDWAEISPPSIIIPAGTEQAIELITYPGEFQPSGRYDAKITLISQDTGAEYHHDIKVSLSSGTFMSFILDPSYITYLIIGLVLLFIIIILLSIFGRKKKTEKKDDQIPETTKSPTEEKTEKIEKIEAKEEIPTSAKETTSPNGWWRWIIVFLAIVLIIAGLYYAYTKITPGSPTESTEETPTEPFMGGYFTPYLDWAGSFISLYRWYILAGLLLALLIIIILVLLSKKDPTPREEKITVVTARTKIEEKKIKKYKPAIKKEKAPAAKTEKKMGGWLVLVLILLFFLLLLVGYYGYTWYTQKAPTEPDPEDAPIEEEFDFSNISCLKKWPKNTEATLDLNIGFTDPDGDTLTFTSNEPEHATILIDERGIATILPDTDFVGIIEAEFYADDGRGFFIPTGSLNLCVTDEGPDSVIWATITDYRNYFLVGAVLLVLIILLIAYNKPIIRFLEEDEKK